MSRLNRIDWLLFALVMLAAIFFRFYGLADTPPGLLSDAAINGNDAWRLFNRGGHTPFLPGNGGREALFIYLQGAAIALFGTTPLAARLPGALADTLAVGLGFWFAHWLARNEPASQRRWLALWVGLAMAGSSWLLSISRLGFRGALAPAVSIAFFWLFLIGWRNGRPVWFALAGLFLGLAGYTYTSAKILPFVLVLSILPDVLFRQRKSLSCSATPLLPCLRNLVITLAAAALVYLPMLVYTLTHPNQLTNRPFSVAIWAFVDTPGELVAELGKNVLATAGFFCCQGNPELILFGLPGRPTFDVGLGLLLLVGLLGALRDFTVIEQRLLAFWFLLGLAPGLLAIEAPHSLRMIAAAAAAFVLLAQGMAVISKAFASLLGPRKVFFLLPLIFTLWLSATGFFTFRNYFIRWPALAETRAVFQADMVELAADVIAHADRGEVIYLPRSLYARPTLRYYLSGPFPPQATAPPPAEPAARVTFWGQEPEASWVRLGNNRATVLPPFAQEGLALLGESMTGATMTTIDPAILAWQKPQTALDYISGPVKLTGATFPTVISSGGTLEVTLFWEAVTQPDLDYQIVVQLLDDARRGWSLNDPAAPAGGAYPTTYWRPGLDRVPDYHLLRLKEDLPVGRYWLAVALFDPGRGVRLPVSPPSGDAPDTLFIGPLKVPPPQIDDEAFIPAPVTFEGVANLLGYRVNVEKLTTGQPLTVELLWQAIGPAAVDYTVFVHLLDAAGNLVAGHDGQPLNGIYPTGLWSPGERVADPHPINTNGLLPGSYQVEVGLYNFATGERVLVKENRQGQALLPAQIEIGSSK